MAARPRPQLVIKPLGGDPPCYDVVDLAGSGKHYRVPLYPAGPICDCEDFLKFGKRKGMACKHTDGVLEYQRTEAAPTSPPAEAEEVDGGPHELGPGLERDVPPPEPPAAAKPPKEVVGSIGTGARPPARAADTPALWSNEAEQAVLGAMMLDQNAARKAVAMLDDEMFYREGHRLLFRAARSLVERCIPIDPVTWRDALASRGDLDRAGGMEYIANEVDAVPTAANVEFHAGIVREKAVRRAFAQRARQAAEADGAVGFDELRRAVAALQDLVLDETGRARFKLLTVEELHALPPQGWLLEDHIPAGGFSVIYGPAGVGKSFLAMSQAFAIAAGVPWFGLPTRPGPVVIAAAEGGWGLDARVRAWQEAEGIAELPQLRILPEPVNLMRPADVDAFLAAIAAAFTDPPALCVFDTLAGSMSGGNENDPKDMGAVVDQVRRISRQTGAAVELIHHTGRDETRKNAERGHVALRGGADVIFKVTGEDGALTLENDKQRDRPLLATRPLRLLPIAGSCVIQPNEATAAPTPSMGKNHWKALRALLENFVGAESGVTAWLKVSAVPEGSFYRTIKELQDFNYVVKRKRLYVVSEAGASALRGTITSLLPSHHDSSPPTINHSGGLI